jgi:6-phosphogluconolactonase
MKQLPLIAIAIFGTMIAATAQSKESYLLVGTYTSPGKSEGIYIYKFNSETGETAPVSSVVTNNPSYVAVSPDEKFVYAVHEVDSRSGKGGEISAFSFDKKKGTLTFINKEPSGGDHPCYVEVDKTGKWVFAGNYSSGSLSVYPVSKDGSLGTPSTIQHTGSGKDPQRQDKPHVHCTYISPDNKWLFVPDLGMDKVMIYAFDARTGKLSPAKQPFAAADPVGGGPRHFIIHPNGKYAYVIEELTGHVVAYKYKNGELKQVQSISTREDKPGYAGSADIHISRDGKFLYASNRGDFNTLASYSIDAATGKLTPLENVSTKGKAPRNFNLDPSGNFLLAANQTSDEVVIFKRDKKTGKLEDSGKRIKVFAPVCLKWISVK